jgi:hypothetical protein
MCADPTNPPAALLPTGVASTTPAREPRPQGGTGAPRAALPAWRLPSVPPSVSFRSAATYYRYLTCDESHRTQPRRHGRCFRCKPGIADTRRRCLMIAKASTFGAPAARAAANLGGEGK